jgi:minor extracellular serine protease Vpr
VKRTFILTVLLVFAIYTTDFIPHIPNNAMQTINSNYESTVFAQNSTIDVNQISKTTSNRLAHPPIPEDEEQIAIVLLKDKQSPAQLLKSFPRLQLRYEFTEVLNGFSVKGPSEDIERLRSQYQQSIVEVSQVQTYQVEETQTGHSETQPFQKDKHQNFKLIGSDRARGLFDRQNRRLTGKGVTVGVIDTGLDHQHPDLKRNYVGGHDLVDNDKDPMETKAGQGQPTLHGTHVTGVIAANGKMLGVAPEANIRAYRALGPGGSGTTEQVLAAIEQAAKDKVDIVNLSLGNSINGPDLPISIALNKLTEKGIVAVTSSGNSGPNKWTVGSPGTASKAISVGASTPILKIPYILIEGSREKIRLEPMVGADKWVMDRSQLLAFGGIGKLNELANVKGKVALIERGEITFTEKAINAQKAGAVGVIIFNNTSGEFIGNLQFDIGLPVASISKKAGHELKRLLDNGHQLIRFIEETEQDVLAGFSSRGPVTRTWEIKPDILAPGVAIQSTVPGGYLSLQGTSMAAPHVAGVAALVKQTHPDWTPQQIKAALMNYALPLTTADGNLYRTYEQGAGRLQIMEAIQAPTLIQPSSLQFGKFQLKDRNHKHLAKLEIENVSDKTIKYSFDIPKKITGMNWRLPLSFTLQPKEKRSVQIELEVDPESFTKEKIQDGYLTVYAGGNAIRLPYIYVLEEPDYPRVMGFEMARGDKPGMLRYQVYLPGGAEEFGIAIFSPDDYRFLGFLDWARNVKKGMLEKEISSAKLPNSGTYVLKVFAKKAGQEDMEERLIEIAKEGNRTLLK